MTEGREPDPRRSTEDSAGPFYSLSQLPAFLASTIHHPVQDAVSHPKRSTLGGRTVAGFLAVPNSWWAQCWIRNPEF